MRLRYLLSLIFAICSIAVSFGQLSTKHFIPPITVEGVSSIQEQYIYISTPSTSNVAYTITYLGSTFTETGVVSNTSPVEIEVKNPVSGAVDFDSDSQFVVTSGSGLINNILTDRGFIIEAQDLVYVSIRVIAANDNHAGALVSKGQSALGNEFRVGGFANTGEIGSFQTFFSIMATENNTNVSIDINGTITNVNLNEDETYIGSFGNSNGLPPNDLLGSLIQSDKPIVMNSGSLNGSFDNGNLGSDYGFDQIVDATKIGTEYIVVKGAGIDSIENILVIAHEDNTEVFVNANTTAEAILNAGEWVVIEGDGIGSNGNGFSAVENMYIRTSNPSFVYQGIGEINTGFPGANQGMFFVPPLSCENRGDVNNIALIDQIGSVGFDGGITIVTNIGSDVTVNGTDIGMLNPQGPFLVPGNNNYVTYKLNGLTGNVSVSSTGELYCAYFNKNINATTGAFYSGFPSPPEITFTADVMSLGNCIPNVTLSAANSDLFDSLEWFFDNGSGFVSTGNTTGIIVPTQAGNYQLVGTLVCSGTTFESQAIPVSLCPDDLDGDLIIDNLDIDSDNDGILDCDESRGNVDLDFTDTNQPVLNFADSTTDNTFITVTDPGTNITGDANSNITATLNANPTPTDQTYTLTFDRASNIQFTQTSGTTHTIVDGETFTLTIGPNTKNLTLVDPDNILLLDADFDGFYEVETTDFSSSVIRFRFNPTPDGTTPFRFVANSVDQISLTHSNTSTTDNSILQANLILTCFGIDTDNDGIVNAFDADSDNDGIPDLIEAQGEPFQILGTDADQDGLDDIFGGNPVILEDSDGDGVPDILDLDSDNDGIYDLFEARHGLPDADLDGRIDNAAALVGMNGWVNSLETAPDSFLIGYDLNGTTGGNLDGDGLFNYLDLDSEDDGCPDVIEAGFADPDADDIIGTSPVTVDAEGKVTGIADGYTVPNMDWETAAPIELNTPFIDIAFCDTSTGIITIDSTADGFQWELSTDGGTNWVTLTNDATYANVTTTSLQITGVNPAFAGHQFRVQLQRTGNSCGDVSNAITLGVEPLPIVMTAELRQCDDDTDGFSIFNLFEASQNISMNFANETFEFYETQADAESGSNIISNPTAYTNQVQSSDMVWARTISTFGCFEVSQVDLIVATSSTVVTNFPPRTLTTCDDFLDQDGNDTAANNDTDGIAFFDIDITTQLLNQFPVNERPDLTINYYRTVTDAQSEVNAITNLTTYRNIGFPGGHQIFIRVDNVNNNECIGFAPLITLVVDPVPTALDVNDIEECDNIDDGDGFNGIIQTFNLDAQTPLILGTSQSPADFTVTYHTLAADALSGANAIITSAAYTNITPNRQTIYVRVVNNTTGCFTNHTSFDLIVNQLPVANAVPDLEICDDDTDGSARNGFSQMFDLELQTPGVLGTQDPNQFNVTYHASLVNAQGGINPLGSPFSNSVPFSQIIYVRVTNGDTGCANGISTFNVIVNPEPITAEVSNLSYCDNDLDGDDTNGFVQNIDLESQILGILDFDNTGQDDDDFTVTFHERPEDATDGSNPLSSPYSNTIANQQTIYVRVVNDDTGCVNDDFTFDVIVNPLPEFEVTTPQIVCLNGPPLTIGAENPSAVYDYVWTDPSGGMLTGQNITITSGGLYRVTATTTDGTGCSRFLEIQVDESIIATITENDVTIIDDSENNSIAIDPTNLGIGDYEYALTDQDGVLIRNYQDEPLFENLEGGIYTILVQDKNGCGVANLNVSVIEFPKFFTPNNDGFNDTWIIKGANSFFYPDSEVNIFNRFGKVVAQINIDDPGWNGTFNSEVLPSDDYWFSIRLVDRDGNMRERKGNFSLLRR